MLIILCPLVVENIIYPALSWQNMGMIKVWYRILSYCSVIPKFGDDSQNIHLARQYIIAGMVVTIPYPARPDSRESKIKQDNVVTFHKITAPVSPWRTWSKKKCWSMVRYLSQQIISSRFQPSCFFELWPCEENIIIYTYYSITSYGMIPYQVSLTLT